jgi:aspartyl-tRNA(Asn)/glutamyl-tRNA(Gln) amidotransferase subunit C
MSKTVITEEEIKKLAILASLDLSSEEVNKYSQEVSSILEMIDKLQQINTDGVEPTYQVSGNQNVTREDLISDASDLVQPSELLGLTPEQQNGSIKVKKVL